MERFPVKNIIKEKYVMKAKRVWAVLLTVSLVAGMAAGCGKKKESSGSTSADGVTELTFYNADLQEDDPWL